MVPPNESREDNHVENPHPSFRHPDPGRRLWAVVVRPSRAGPCGRHLCGHRLLGKNGPLRLWLQLRHARGGRAAGAKRVQGRRRQDRGLGATPGPPSPSATTALTAGPTATARTAPRTPPCRSARTPAARTRVSPSTAIRANRERFWGKCRRCPLERTQRSHHSSTIAHPL